MADLMQEVQEILGRGQPPAGSAARSTTESADPADQAFDLLKTAPDLATMLQKKLDGVSASMGDARKQAERLAKMGAGGALAALDLIEGKPLSALKALRSVADEAVKQVERIVVNGKRGRGSMGRREGLDKHLDWLDARIASLSEGQHDPRPDRAPTNAASNDYSPELIAAAKAAAGYIDSATALRIGSPVHIGRKSLAVVGEPKMVDQGILVHLAPADSPEAHHNPGEAYTLMIPVAAPTSPPPSMGSAQRQVAPTAEAVLTLGDRSVKILAADLRLEAGDYGDHITDYGDYGPAMGRIKPGDKVSGILTPTVFRVIGKSGNSALVQPDSMDAETYGRFRAAAQFASTPVGQGTPSVPTVDLWRPGMGRIPAGQDFPGRGAKAFRDAMTSAPAPTPTGQEGMSGTGDRTSLVGTRVLNYNPHSGKYSMATGKMPGDYAMADMIQIVGHDPSLPTAVGLGEMTVERFEHAINEAAGSTVLEKLAAVVESGAAKVNGVLMEPEVAAVMLQLHRAVNEQNQQRMASMGIHEMLEVSQRMLMRLSEAKPQSEVKKTIAPHMWVIVEDRRNHFMVTIGDPRKSGSKVKFSGDLAGLKEWVRDNVGTKVSEDHVIDTTKNKLVPPNYSKWYVETQMGKGKGKGKKEGVDAPEAGLTEFQGEKAAKEYEKTAGSSKPGEGKRFEKLKAAIKAKGSATDAGAVAASIGRKKYGKAKFQKMAAAGKKEEVETALFFHNAASAEAALESMDLDGIEHELDGSTLFLKISEEQLGKLCLGLTESHVSFFFDDELTEAFGTHIIKNAKGTFSFVGDVPYRLGYIRTDGKELSDDDIKKLKEAHKTSTPALAFKAIGVKSRVFKSYEEAEKAAKKLGVKISKAKAKS